MESKGYKLSYGAYCKVHGAEIEIERAENDSRLEALFQQKIEALYGDFEELYGQKAEEIKKLYLWLEKQQLHEVFELLKEMKEAGVITIDYGKEMTVPEKYTPDKNDSRTPDHSRQEQEVSEQSHPEA